MKILLGNNHLHTVGGTETFTYTLAEALVSMGHSVDILTLVPGQVSVLLERNFGCRINKLSESYDKVFLNHNSTVNIAKRYIDPTQIVQVCHGTIPDLEQPAAGVRHIAISPEVHSHLSKLGYTSDVILNPVNCTKYAPKQQLNEKLQKVFSLAQDESFNNRLQQVCRSKGIEFAKRNKHVNPTIDVSQEMLSADLVVTLGRGCYESMSCGKSVLIADAREYQGGLMDGLVKVENFSDFIVNNCSGRTCRIDPTEDAIVAELEKYSADDGIINRSIAENLFDATKIAEQYLSI
jgi:hypothetical protein